MTCDRCGTPCQGRLCSGCRSLEAQENIGTPTDFVVCEGCGESGRDVVPESFPDGREFDLCESCSEGAREMWANWALRHPQQANSARARGNAARRSGQRSLTGGSRR